MTKPYFEKELTFTKEKKAHEYNEKVAAIKAEIAQINIKKKEAKTYVPKLKEEISKLVTDVEIVTNPIKRKSVLKKKRELQEELEEWELIAGMDVEEYERKNYEDLVDLGREAEREKNLYEKRVREFKRELELIHDKQIAEIKNVLANKHPFYRFEKEYKIGGLRIEEESKKIRAIEDKKKFDRREIYQGAKVIGYQVPIYNENGEFTGYENKPLK